jgi:hypothetical protein
MEIKPVTKAKKPKPAKKAWWKFWQAPEAKPPKAIAYDPHATETGTVRNK